jgi:hypothetical protein
MRFRNRRVQSNGLISFSEKALKYKLLQFIYKESKEREHVEKYTTIGKDAPGDFERSLRITLTKDEKETLIWIWGDLLRLRLITPLIVFHIGFSLDRRDALVGHADPIIRNH